MFVPAFMHIIGGVGVLFFSWDLPDGNYALLKKSGGMSKDVPSRVFLTAISNYRCALISLAYHVAAPLFTLPVACFLRLLQSIPASPLCFRTGGGFALPSDQVAIIHCTLCMLIMHTRRTRQMPTTAPHGHRVLSANAPDSWSTLWCRMWCLTITYGFCFGVELTMNNIIVTYLFDQFGVSLTIAGVLGSMFGLMNLFARSVGGLGSDLAGKRFGMRGRLWALWLMQTFEGALCIFMGLAKDSLGATMVIMITFSLFVQASEGASYGVVPFVSKRALGVVSGFVGAGGNAGSAITQTLFFKDAEFETYTGLVYMGIMVMCVTLLVVPVYFPMWGGMLCGPREGVVEEDYYLGEFSEEERAAGMADAAMKFAQESKSQRGAKQRDATQDDIQLGNPPKVEAPAA